MVLVPTRELARATEQLFKSLASFINPPLRSHLLIGGRTLTDEITTLRQGQHLIVGTPGRLSAILSMGYLDATRLKMWILDEMDDMLSKGSEEFLHDIFMHVPLEAQIAFFSATLPSDCLSLVRKFMTDPIKIDVPYDTDEKNPTMEGVIQFHVDCEKEEWKYDTLCDLLEAVGGKTQTIIYCNTQRKAEWLSDRMIEAGYKVCVLPPHHALLSSTPYNFSFLFSSVIFSFLFVLSFSCL